MVMIQSMLFFSESYSSPPRFLLMNDSRPMAAYPLSQDKEIDFSIITGQYSKNIFHRWAQDHPNQTLYFGIRLELKLMTLEDIKSHPKFIMIVDDKWAVFSKNDKYYQVVNLVNSEGYQITTKSLTSYCVEMKDPMYFYIEKDSLSPVISISIKKEKVRDFQVRVIEELELYKRSISKPELPKIVETPPPKIEETPPPPKEEEPEKKVRGFWDFLKGK
jgi:hypothetical protein